MNELDQLVADYKHIADNHGEHRVKDLVWLVNELIYEREHQSAGVTPRVLELIQQRITEDDGGPNAEYCWYCHADVNGKHGPNEPHASDCWRVLIEAAVRESVASVPAAPKYMKPRPIRVEDESVPAASEEQKP